MKHTVTITLLLLVAALSSCSKDDWKWDGENCQVKELKTWVAMSYPLGYGSGIRIANWQHECKFLLEREAEQRRLSEKEYNACMNTDFSKYTLLVYCATQYAPVVESVRLSQEDNTAYITVRIDKSRDKMTLDAISGYTTLVRIYPKIPDGTEFVVDVIEE